MWPALSVAVIGSELWEPPARVQKVPEIHARVGGIRSVNLGAATPSTLRLVLATPSESKAFQVIKLLSVKTATPLIVGPELDDASTLNEPL